MTTISHAVFGLIDSSASDFWEANIDHDGRTVSIDMTIDDSEVSREDFEAAFRFVDDFGKYEVNARRAILDDLEGDADSAARLYVSHHLLAMTADELASVFGDVARAEIEAAQFLSRLKLVRVGLYPKSDESRALFDFSIAMDITNYLLGVSFDREGQVSGVDLES